MMTRTVARKIIAKLGLLGVAFRIQERLSAWTASGHEGLVADDGLPIPEPSLIVSVGGHANVAAFLEGGRIIADAIREIVHSHGAKLEAMNAILDFGCGCGRLLRHWRDLPGSVALHGTDYNRKAVRWCANNLSFVRCAVNRRDPPLAYAADHFDFIYAFSVFTHFSATMQREWIRELARITAPGGYILITVHGKSFFASMTAEEQASFNRGELVVRHSSMAGSNLCAAFHPVAYLKTFSAELDLVDHLPAKVGQDAVLFRKPLPDAREAMLHASER
jgi:SAM-dependent methyltransferase